MLAPDPFRVIACLTSAAVLWVELFPFEAGSWIVAGRDVSIARRIVPLLVRSAESLAGTRAADAASIKIATVRTLVWSVWGLLPARWLCPAWLSRLASG